MAAGFDLTGTARSLLNIEVNTIIRDNMTAEPMPAVPHALLDIARDYAETLTSLGIDVRHYFAAKDADPAAVDLVWLDSPPSVTAELTVAPGTFDRLRWAAEKASIAEDARALRIPRSKRVLLDRIVNNCDEIKEIFKRFPPSMNQFLDKTRLDLTRTTIQRNSYVVAPDDLILLQKIWDIGVEEIVAQTVVHLTGDVTTRIQEALGRSGSAPLFAIHRQSIDVSVGCWRYLLDAVREIAGTAARVLLAGRG
jgi:hypothetical protein